MVIKFFRFLYVLFLCIAISAPCFSQKAPKSILVIHSYHTGYTWNDSLSSGILSTLNKNDNVDVYVEYLDGKRYEDSLYFKQLFQIYSYKYKKGFFDLVILSDNLALEFSLKYGKRLFGDVPVVFCGVNNPYIYNLSNKPYYCILQTQEDEKVIRQLEAIRPDLKNLYFISDKTETGQEDMMRIKCITKHLSSAITYHFIDDIEIDTLFDSVKKINKNDAIFLVSLQRDKHGVPLNYKHMTSRLCAISPVPVFSSHYPNIGRGIAGGCFANAVTQGTLSAQLALNMLFTPNFNPPRLTIPTPEFYFDYAVLKRFSISMDALPKNSKFINLPENVYVKYKKEILITLSVILFLVFVIMLLLKNIQRRKIAEKIIVKQYSEIQIQNKDILCINQNLNDSNAELEMTNEMLSNVNTELVVAKERAEESDRLKTAFLQNMSHEIRTPMHAIMSFSRLLFNSFDNKSELDVYVRLINQHCEDLLVIINDVLDIAKIESGQLTVNKEQFKVADIFSELTLLFEEQKKRLEKQHISLIMSCSPDIRLFTDKLKLKQILINLISNALKFTEVGSVEVVCMRVDNNQIQFSVKDSGIGIPIDKQSFIFERFVQVESCNTRLHGGTGLGLSIVKGLLDLLGSAITLKSELGKGSVFTFTIPM